MFRILWWIERSKEQHFFEIEIFCYILNVTFDQLNVSLWNKSINFFQKPKGLNSNVYYWIEYLEKWLNSCSFSICRSIEMSRYSYPFRN